MPIAPILTVLFSFISLTPGGAASVEECWELVHTSEKTGKFCMLLENCCYDRKEMAIFNMVKQGLFGEIVNCEGGYRHDLRDEIVLGRENIHGRLFNFMNRNGELYPTHQLGPICKLLDINRGNRLLTLVSVASKSRGLNVWIEKNKGTDYDLYGYPFEEGDVVTTIIKTAHGETITLHHDCCLPRPYSRNYVVQGTKGIFTELSDTDSYIAVDGVTDTTHAYEPIQKYIDKYDHPLWKKLITCISEQSVAMGGMPVPIPDFTNGMWVDREKERRGEFCLSEVCDEFFDKKDGTEEIK